MISSRASCWVVSNPLGTTLIPLRIHGFSQSGSERWDNLVSILSEQFPFFKQNKNRLVDLLKNRVRLQRLTVKPKSIQIQLLKSLPHSQKHSNSGDRSDRSHLWINLLTCLILAPKSLGQIGSLAESLSRKSHDFNGEFSPTRLGGATKRERTCTVYDAWWMYPPKVFFFPTFVEKKMSWSSRSHAQFTFCWWYLDVHSMHLAGSAFI